MLALHVLGHLQCIGEQADLPVTAWVVIPSMKSSKRYGGEHPLHSMVSHLLPFLPKVSLCANNETNRCLNPELLSMEPDKKEAELSHVLLIDDSWVSGGTAQSAAVCLKQAGCKQVSIYCAAHIVRESFIATWNSTPFTSFKTKHHNKMGQCPWLRRFE